MKRKIQAVRQESAVSRVVALTAVAFLAVFAYWDSAEELFSPKVETGTMLLMPDVRETYTFVVPQAIGEFCSIVSADTEALAALRDANNSAEELFSLFAYRDGENGERVLALSIPIMKLLSAEITFITSDEQKNLPPRKVGDNALLHCLKDGFSRAFSTKEYGI